MQDQQFQVISPEPAGAGPNNPPWNSAVALGIWAASVVLILIGPGVFLAPYLLYHGARTMNQKEIAEIAGSDPTAILIQIVGIIPVHLITLLIAWLVVTNFRRLPFRDTLGWRSGGIRWWHYVVIIIGFFAVSGIVGYYIPEQENDLIRIIRSSRLALYAVAVLAVFTAPIVEEVVYRGLLYSAFQRSVGTIAAVVVVTILFALVHVPQYYPSISTIMLLTLLSLVLTLVRVQTGNLLPCIILHTAFNAMQSLVLIIEPSVNAPGQSPAEQAGMFFHLIK